MIGLRYILIVGIIWQVSIGHVNSLQPAEIGFATLPDLSSHIANSTEAIRIVSNNQNSKVRATSRFRKAVKKTTEKIMTVDIPSPATTLSQSHSTKFVAECNLPTQQGIYRMRSYVYSSSTQNLEPIAMVYGELKGKQNVLVRVHDQCFTSEVFGSLRCDCREQLKESLRAIKEEGGVVIYLQQEGRGIGIANKVAAYALQDQGLDTVDANIQLGFKDELREYLTVPDILKDLGIESIRLLTNNPYKIQQLESLGVKIVERIPIQVTPNPFNQRYLTSKRTRMHHFLSSSHDDILSKVRGGAREMSSNQDEEEELEEELNKTKDFAFSPLAAAEKVLKVPYALGKDTVLEAIAAIQRGELVIVVDDADRENEGDLIMAAEKATPEAIGFMVRYTSGVICVSLEQERLNALALPPMVINNEDPKQTAYTVSVDYRHNTSTGISAADRALTFQKLVDLEAKKEDFQRPGHVFPLRYKEGGVLNRMGHTEASLDLTKLAGLKAGGVLAEIVHDDGSMMRFPSLQEFAREHNLVFTSVQDIKAYRTELQEDDAEKKEEEEEQQKK